MELGFSRSILIVEDDANLRKLTANIFLKAGYEVHIASGGKQAMQVYGANKIDVILTDLMMPEGDGISFVSELRRRGGVQPVVCIMSGHSYKMSIVENQIRPDAIVAKPFNRNSIVEQVFRAVERNAARRLSVI